MQDGVYLYEDGKITPATQAIRETENQVTFLLFGRPTTQDYIPIDETCSKCKETHFKDVKICQARQKEDAERRGFTKIICPNQLIEGEKDGRL
jgi:hypothetical protein